MTENDITASTPENLGAETPADGPTAPDPTQTTGEAAQPASEPTSGETGESGAEGDGEHSAPAESSEPDPADLEYHHPDDGGDGGEDDGTDDGGDTGDVGKLRREAARHRTRAKEAAAEGENTIELLNQTRQRFLEDTCRAARLDPRLMAAAGIDAGHFVDETGMLDTNAISESIETVRDEFRVPRGYGPNRAQDSHGQVSVKPSMADVFRR